MPDTRLLDHPTSRVLDHIVLLPMEGLASQPRDGAVFRDDQCDGGLLSPRVAETDVYGFGRFGSQTVMMHKCGLWRNAASSPKAFDVD